LSHLQNAIYDFDHLLSKKDFIPKPSPFSAVIQYVLGKRTGIMFNRLLFFLLFVLLNTPIVTAQCTAKVGSNPVLLNGCDPFTIQFNDISTGTVVNRSWKFGDGSAPSSSNNPVHTFTTTTKDTIYFVKLVIQCLNGTKDSITKQVTVYAKPTVDFTVSKTTVCALNDSACFSIISPFGAGYTALWNFGDFTNSNLKSPCHTYGTNGLYNVDLTVTNTNGCLRSLTKSNYVNAVKLPSPDFTMNNFIGCAPLAVTFSNTTNTASDPISQWEWDFDDGSPKSSLMNPGSHNYAIADTFFVKLKAVNSLGCYNTTTKVVQVKATPTASFSFSPTVCAGSANNIAYTGSSLSSASYSWSFDGAKVLSGSGKGPYQLAWDTSGAKELHLSVLQNGCTAQSTYTVFVFAQPLVGLKSNAINDTTCEKAIVKFTGQPQYYPQYSFFLNGVLVQNTADSTYTNANLNNGDIVTWSSKMRKVALILFRIH
jgi:PKD repeat protein